ncbi:short-chain dehydrogenase/reductase SDR [Novosphingobium aromaticivorans DSM 12444]|uniref:Short-chain dehydrogenase/reductase SDR n=1 Tax=Novosphingobium aromaticivorans (strain ATCC 700278 / DSM 12444 / CCUG 56034 / CIP 105152 / NBRC 16084 / F199) TaxID=279238 RepID=Q2G4C1_NOVAD|nr:SDR family NAD(P)-dependent oxidoreductase [Novosphingobium aromaticivorans]ABD27302.1 short-chain dehydrogenase/reductase SDR [Novosphingobium aromaticivorans DSM 12444]SCY66568.1 NAD(P)-dependent dehydrogenase, short-chain alcohol dehydrogenase family [Novosphingobium aromaticivorans]
MTDLSGKHVVITGASTGIGRATATRCVAAGARVTLIARRADLLEQAARELGGSTAFAAADVADKAALKAALDHAVAANGPIDGLFLNAGIGGMFAPVEDYGDEAFDAVLAVNLKSVFWAIQHALPAMKERGQGAILVTGSLASERGLPMNAGYVASKHAVLGLSRAVANEAAEAGVRCNCILPGLIETPMLDGLPPEAASQMARAVPQGRTGSSDEVAQVAAFLLSDAASHVTAQALAVDGGMLGTMRV